jgi:predicted GH43/DUF377 family glycosyl hydrolase
LGASLFDLDDPSKEIGRLKDLLPSPREEEREVYVPNIVYFCSSIIHNNSLILLYAVSDYSPIYGVANMLELLDALKKANNGLKLSCFMFVLSNSVKFCPLGIH